MSRASGASFDTQRTQSAQPSREVKCQICPWSERRYFGKGVLVKPCPDCGSRVTFAMVMVGDAPVTPEPKLAALIHKKHSDFRNKKGDPATNGAAPPHPDLTREEHMVEMDETPSTHQRLHREIIDAAQ
jgi:hypothetical protein